MNHSLGNKKVTIPANDPIMAVQGLMRQFSEGGDKRFTCECGDKFVDGGIAVEHSFSGHEVVQEVYRGGMWVYNGTRKPIMEMIADRLRLKGESIKDFTNRLNSRLDELEREDGDR